MSFKEKQDYIVCSLSYNCCLKNNFRLLAINKFTQIVHLHTLQLEMLEEIYNSFQIFSYKLKGKYTYFSSNTFENLSKEISALEEYSANQFANYSQILVDILTRYIQVSQPLITLQINTTISKNLFSKSHKYTDFGKVALKHILNNMIELSKLMDRNQAQLCNFLYRAIYQNNTDENSYLGQQKLLYRFNINIQMLRQHVFNNNLFEIIYSLAFRNKNAHACFLETLIWFSERAQFNQLKPVFTLILSSLRSQNNLLNLLGLYSLRSIIIKHRFEFWKLEKYYLLIEQATKMIISKDDSNIVFLATDLVLICLDQFTDKQLVQKYFVEFNKKLMDIADNKPDLRLKIKSVEAFCVFSTVYQLVTPQLSQQYFQIVLRLLKSKSAQLLISSCYFGCKLLQHSSQNVAEMYLIPIISLIWNLRQTIPIRNLLSFWRIICRSSLQNPQWKQYFMSLMKIQNYKGIQRSQCFQFFKAIQATIHYAKADYICFCEQTISILIWSLKENMRLKKVTHQAIKYIILSFRALIIYLQVPKQPVLEVSSLLTELFISQLINENDRETILQLFSVIFQISWTLNECLMLWKKAQMIIKYLISNKSNIVISNSGDLESDTQNLMKFQSFWLQKHEKSKMQELQEIVSNKQMAISGLKELFRKQQLPIELKTQLLSLIYLQTYNIHSQNDIRHAMQIGAVTLSCFSSQSITESQQTFYISLFQRYICQDSNIVKEGMISFIKQCIDKKVLRCVSKNTVNAIQQYLSTIQHQQSTACMGNLIYHTKDFSLISDFLYEWVQKLPLKLDLQQNKSQIKKLIELLNIPNFIDQCFCNRDQQKGLRNLLGLLKSVTNYFILIQSQRKNIQQISINHNKRRSKRILKDVKAWEKRILSFNQNQILFNFALKQVQKVLSTNIIPAYKAQILSLMTIEQINILKSYGIL